MPTPNLPNLDTIKSWAETASAAMAAVKTAVSFLPSGKKREEAERLLAEAEKAHEQIEAALAQKLGFELCQYCWPPQIVLMSPEKKRLECRHCHRPPLRIEHEENFWQVAQKNQLNHDV